MYSHATRPLCQSEQAYYLSYFINDRISEVTRELIKTCFASNDVELESCFHYVRIGITVY